MLKRQSKFLVHTVMPPPPKVSPNANPTSQVWNTAARAEISASNCEQPEHAPHGQPGSSCLSVNSVLDNPVTPRGASLQDEEHTWALQPGFKHRFLFLSSKKMKAATIHTPAVFPPSTILGLQDRRSHSKKSNQGKVNFRHQLQKKAQCTHN